MPGPTSRLVSTDPLGGFLKAEPDKADTMNPRRDLRASTRKCALIKPTLLCQNFCLQCGRGTKLLTE
jgi:hypothetical protein